MNRPQTLVFTDLDGTLLDPVTYSFEEALPALELIKSQGIPLILCSSKTRAEMTVIRQQLGNQHPFISENGGGVYIPRGYFTAMVEGAKNLNGNQLVAFGTPHADIRRQFVALRAQLGVKARGFTDMSVRELAERTGLDLAAAALAKQRDFDEPFVFDGAPDLGFLQALQAAGLNWTQGQFFHVMGQHDKGRAVLLLKALYQLEYGTVLSIGLGDGWNDLPLLKAVDKPVLVQRSAASSPVHIDFPGLVKTQSPGVKGWNDVLVQCLHATGETVP
jgi:mannosyl-3-phosphoglycerate phosphatase family protein